MPELKLTVGIPVSVNHYLAYRAIIKNGKPMAMSYKTKEALEYQKWLIGYLKDETKKQNWTLTPDKARHFYVDAYFYFPVSTWTPTTIGKFFSTRSPIPGLSGSTTMSYASAYREYSTTRRTRVSNLSSIPLTTQVFLKTYLSLRVLNHAASVVADTNETVAYSPGRKPDGYRMILRTKNVSILRRFNYGNEKSKL